MIRSIRYKIFLFLILILLVGCIKEDVSNIVSDEEINLPRPKYDSEFSIEKALSERRSVRSFKDEALSLEEVSQLLWAAQGIDGVTSATRRAPSAGATQPLEVYFIAKKINGLEKGAYRYNPNRHSIIKVSEEDFSGMFIPDAPLLIVITAIYERTTGKYGVRGVRFVDMEVGHCAQNIQLQAISLGIGSVTIGVFNEARLREVLKLEEEKPIYILAVGKV